MSVRVRTCVHWRPLNAPFFLCKFFVSEVLCPQWGERSKKKDSMIPLKCGFQPYAWGKKGDTSKVASLVGESDASKRYAELWIGTHPSNPSFVSGSSSKLKDALTVETLGPEHIQRFGSDVPFLLKVLSIDTALSVQAHPHLELAKVLHARDPKNYPDPNHKPELVVALTPYEALCCFRPLQEVAKFLREIPPLRGLIPNAADFTATADPKTVLRNALEALYAQPPAAVQSSINEHLKAIESMPHNKAYEHVVFARTAGQYPGDVGCWMVFFLNLVRLNPGDGLFLAPNEPHSYLAGDSVEIMASSDNVVRAGLTPKFKDVKTLLDMLTYRTDSLRDSFYKVANGSVQVYSPPAWCEEFKLTAVRLPAGKSTDIPAASSFALGIVVDGTGTINGEAVKLGSAFALPVGAPISIAATSPFAVYIATTNKKATSSL